MEITYQGTGCVRLKGRDLQVVVDPPDGSRAAAAADVVISTFGATDVGRLRATPGRPQMVSGPGEYEIRGVAIRGWPEAGGAIMRICVDEVRVVALGKLNRQLTEDEIDDLGHVDVLLVPVGGDDVLNSSEATRLVRKVEPAVVVPTHHSGGGDQRYDAVDKFAREMGLPDAWSAQPKLSLSGSSGSTDETRVVVLEART